MKFGYRSLLALLCGSFSLSAAAADIQPRIIGGQDTSIDKWPGMAAIVRSPDVGANLFNRQFCGGTLIDDQWVLSAAHCFFVEDASGEYIKVPAESIRVVLGIDNLNSQPEELVVTNIITHENYDPRETTSPNDIALLELANAVSDTPMRLTLDSVSAGADATVIGWGATRYDAFTQEADRYPEKLKEVDVPVVSNSVCNSSYGGLIVSSQICAGFEAGGKDSCGGDSGGPLIIESNGQLQQAGVVSYGNGCALAEFYGVYTRTSSFLDWIGQYSEDAVTPDSNGSGGSSSSGGGGALGGLALLALAGLGFRVGRRRGVK